jgi:hypothetical protein
MTNVKRIESYGLYDFCQDVQEAFKEGYVFDFDTNENFPTAYGTMLTCGLVKAGKKVEEKAEETTETVTETSQTEEVVQNTEQTEEVVTEETKVETEVQETAEATPAKRGPKPKNK